MLGELPTVTMLFATFNTVWKYTCLGKHYFSIFGIAIDNINTIKNTLKAGSREKSQLPLSTLFHYVKECFL
jgi:hypothetical protein